MRFNFLSTKSTHNLGFEAKCLNSLSIKSELPPLSGASTTIVNRAYLFFSVKDRNLLHRVDTIGNIFTSGQATSENISDGVHEKKKTPNILFISYF